jgi:hypothetical protein
MARWALSARSRFVLLQVIMWFILGATVALAAWVSSAAGIQLGPEQPFEGMRLRLPRGWVVNHDTQNRWVIVEAVEYRNQQPQRAIAVFRQPVPTGMTAEQYLALSGLLRGPRPSPSALEPITIDGYEGLLVGAQASVTRPDGSQAIQTLVEAVVILPSQEAIRVQLQAAGAFQAIDRDLLWAVASSIRIDEPAADRQEEIFQRQPTPERPGRPEQRPSNRIDPTITTIMLPLRGAGATVAGRRQLS